MIGFHLELEQGHPQIVGEAGGRLQNGVALFLKAA